MSVCVQFIGEAVETQRRWASCPSPCIIKCWRNSPLVLCSFSIIASHAFPGIGLREPAEGVDIRLDGLWEGLVISSHPIPEGLVHPLKSGLSYVMCLPSLLGPEPSPRALSLLVSCPQLLCVHWTLLKVSISVKLLNFRTGPISQSTNFLFALFFPFVMGFPRAYSPGSND